MKVSIVLVHYHTPHLVGAAFEALDCDLRAAGLEADWVLVDNGSRPQDQEVLRSFPGRVIDPGGNLGYAGGANLGVKETRGELVFLMNPDVRVLPGCAAALRSALEEGAAVAGPRFFWDSERCFLLPPTEKRTRRDELLRVLAERGDFWARRGRQRWRRHARRSWNAREPYVSYELSGAFLAFRRRVWEELGGFDEGYRLYFEETDWLERLRRRRLESRFVPGAEAVHLYAQATVGEPRAEAWFLDSHRRFRRRFYGAAFAAFVESLGRRRAAEPRRTVPEAAPAGPAAWLEVSTSALGYPAAGRRLPENRPAGAMTLPDEIRGQLAAGRYYLRTVDAGGREIGSSTVEIG